MRSSTILPNGMIPRQQNTIDETVVINGDSHEISMNNVNRTLRPTENGVGLCDFHFLKRHLKALNIAAHR